MIVSVKPTVALVAVIVGLAASVVEIPATLVGLTATLQLTVEGLMQPAPVNNVVMALKLSFSPLVTEISLEPEAMATGRAAGQAIVSVVLTTVPEIDDLVLSTQPVSETLAALKPPTLFKGYVTVPSSEALIPVVAVDNLQPVHDGVAPETQFVVCVY